MSNSALATTIDRDFGAPADETSDYELYVRRAHAGKTVEDFDAQWAREDEDLEARFALDVERERRYNLETELRRLDATLTYLDDLRNAYRAEPSARIRGRLAGRARACKARTNFIFGAVIIP